MEKNDGQGTLRAQSLNVWLPCPSVGGLVCLEIQSWCICRAAAADVARNPDPALLSNWPMTLPNPSPLRSVTFGWSGLLFI